MLYWTLSIVWALSFIQKDKDVFIDYRWKNRISVIKTSSFNKDDYQLQKVAYQELKAELQDRDLIVLAIESSSGQMEVWYGEIALASSEVQQVLATYFRKEDQGQILIGKDGGLKLRSAKLIDTKELFSVIDGMSMRRSEMEQNN